MPSLTIDNRYIQEWVDEEELREAATAVAQYFDSLGSDRLPADSAEEEPTHIVDHLARDDTLQDVVWQGVLSDAVEAAEAVRKLFALDMPDDGPPYHPMDRTTSDTRYYRSLDGDTWLIAPEDDGNLSFERQIRTGLTHVHNVHQLKQTEIPVPDISVMVTGQDGELSIYTVMERVGDLTAEPSDDIPMDRYNDLGYRLAVEKRQISYFDAISRDDFVPNGGVDYFVNPGQYREGRTDRQLRDSIVPDIERWSDRDAVLERTPYHFTVTGQGATTVYKRGSLSRTRAPVA
ncbi:MAG: hypothetical protein SVW02_00940 [Candidatus Nanohaloarchaea archaeon]|nr:hypothetical protein [Candidatus Nanohaloarchaea archaeon]